MAIRSLPFHRAPFLALAVLAAFGAGPAAAQALLPGDVSFGLWTSRVTVAESGAPGDSGHALGVRMGLPIAAPVTLETRYGRTLVDHGAVQAVYRLWEAHLGPRYHFRRASSALRPYVEALGGIQVGQIDRAGITPGPDLTGVGGVIGAGANVRLVWRFWASVGVETGWTWVQHGRVENGDWQRLPDERRFRTRTSRLIAGINGHL